MTQPRTADVAADAPVRNLGELSQDECWANFWRVIARCAVEQLATALESTSPAA